MSLSGNLRQLHLIKRNARWWGTPLSRTEKASYYAHMTGAFARTFLTKKSYINYLGRPLYYDNVIMPLSLQAYPDEIFNSILANTTGHKISRVLDIGGNIGQFSLTLSYALKAKAQIDVLEPNSEIFELLQKNTEGKTNFKTYNFGIGRPATKHLFYTPGKSATGSVFKSNTTNEARAKKTKVAMSDDIAKITGHSKYDLVKIDVEGYEYQLLEAVKPFSTKFMFIEISLGRYKDFSHSKLFELIEEKFGEFDIVHLSGSNATSNNFDALLKFL